MEHFRSSGTSGGLLHSRTESAYVKAAVSDLLRNVGPADAEAIASGRISTGSLKSLRESAARVVGESWLDLHGSDEAVTAFHDLSAETEPMDIDSVLSNVLRVRFPAETVRPERNSRWG